jgi:hypothetical protein
MPARAPWGAVGEFAASRHGAFHRRQAAALGLSPTVIARLLRQGYLVEPIPGVLVVAGSADTWHRRLSVATSVQGRLVAAGFRSAAALHRLQGYEPGPLEVLVDRRTRIGLPDVVVHSGPLCDRDIVVIDGIPCTSIARTLADLGTVDPASKVELAFNDAWRRGVGLRMLRSTAEALHRPGQAGTGVLLALVADAEQRRRPLESPLEARVERLLAAAGVQGVVRQHVVLAPDGAFVARVDFAVPALRLAFEAHSARHHGAASHIARDEDRHRRLTRISWLADYITNDDLLRPADTVRRVGDLVSRRSAELDMRWVAPRWVAAAKSDVTSSP